jgi:hypothetical protein
MYFELRYFSNRPDHAYPYCFNVKTFICEKKAIEAFNETKDITEKCWNDLAAVGMEAPVASMLQLVARNDESTWLDEIKLWERENKNAHN